MSQTFSTGDVAKHNKGDDLFIIVDGDVYDLTKFQDEHPGGKKSMFYPRCNRCACCADTSHYHMSARRRTMLTAPPSQSLLVLLARMPRSSSGSTTMRAF